MTQTNVMLPTNLPENKKKAKRKKEIIIDLISYPV